MSGWVTVADKGVLGDNEYLAGLRALCKSGGDTVVAATLSLFRPFEEEREVARRSLPVEVVRFGHYRGH